MLSESAVGGPSAAVACCHAGAINNALTIFGAFVAKSRVERGFYGFRFVNGRPLSSAASPKANAMLIVCPTCATAYQINLAALGEGRQVRCSHCRNTWFASAGSVIEQPVMELAAAQGERAPAGRDDIAAFDPPREEIIAPQPA